MVDVQCSVAMGSGYRSGNNSLIVRIRIDRSTSNKYCCYYYGAPVAVVAAEAVVDATCVLVFVEERKETKAHEQAIVARNNTCNTSRKIFYALCFTKLIFFVQCQVWVLRKLF